MLFPVNPSTTMVIISFPVFQRTTRCFSPPAIRKQMLNPGTGLSPPGKLASKDGVIGNGPRETLTMQHLWHSVHSV